MFSYYGSKSKIVDYYPAPTYGKIIEPFAGSARYSLKYWDREVVILDKYPVVASIWKWLQLCSRKDIMDLPFIPTGGRIIKEQLPCIEAYELLRFLYQQGTVGGNKTYEWGCRRFIQNRSFIADSLHKIRHWKIIEGSYENLENESATWFIDPPYFVGGNRYKASNKNIDYNHLSEWSKSRLGQIIVCENTSASWLPFTPLVNITGIRKKTTEAIYTNSSLITLFQ